MGKRVVRRVAQAFRALRRGVRGNAGRGMSGGKGDGPMLPRRALWCATRQEPGSIVSYAAAYKYSPIVQQVRRVENSLTIPIIGGLQPFLYFRVDITH